MAKYSKIRHKDVILLVSILNLPKVPVGIKHRIAELFKRMNDEC